MLNLVEASRSLHVILLCWNASEHLPPQIYSTQTPWGTTEWDAGAAKGWGCKPENHLCWCTQRGLLVSCSCNTAATTLLRQSIHEVIRRKYPSSAPATALREVTASCLRKRLCYWSSAMHIGIDGRDAMLSPRGRKSNPPGTVKFSWWIYVSHNKKPQRNICWFFHKM